MKLRQTVNIVIASLVVILTVSVIQPVRAQFSYNNTIGNETENNQKYMFAVNEARNYRTGIISNPNLRQFSSSSGLFPSFHSRNGSGTGIGGSTFQTTSITSESAPALVRPSSLSIGVPLIGRPDLSIQFGSSAASPALSSLTIRSPAGDEFNNFSRAEPLTNTRSLVPNVFMHSASDDFQFGE